MRDYFDYPGSFDFAFEQSPEYTRIHHVVKNKFIHIWWNLFLRPSKSWGIGFHNRVKFIGEITFYFYFGIGEFIIDFKVKKA